MKAKTNGIEINHTIEGQGPWVVISHSLAFDRSMWDEQALILKSQYRVLRFDTRGPCPSMVWLISMPLVFAFIVPPQADKVQAGASIGRPSGPHNDAPVAVVSS